MLTNIPLTRREQSDRLQTHWLVPVLMNGRGPFRFAVEVTRTKTLVAASTFEDMGIDLEQVSSTVVISEKLQFPLVRVKSLAVGEAILNDFEVVAWGHPRIPRELLENRPEGLYGLGGGVLPVSAIATVLECRGVLGLDFLSRFRVSFDFTGAILRLET